MKRIQVKTRLHSTGSHNGSSSVKLASMKNIIIKPRTYKRPSPKTVLYTLKNLVEAALIKSITRRRTQLSKKRFKKDLNLFKVRYTSVCFPNFLNRILWVNKMFVLRGLNLKEGLIRVYLLGVRFRKKREETKILLSITGFRGKILSQTIEIFVHVR